MMEILIIIGAFDKAGHDKKLQTFMLQNSGLKY